MVTKLVNDTSEYLFTKVDLPSSLTLPGDSSIASARSSRSCDSPEHPGISLSNKRGDCSKLLADPDSISTGTPSSGIFKGVDRAGLIIDVTSEISVSNTDIGDL